MLRACFDPLLRSGKVLARRFARQDRGVAAVEFAFLLPVMIALYAGTADVSRGLAIHWKMVSLSRTLADLTSQSIEITNQGMTDIFRASRSVLAPYDGLAPRMMVASVVIGPNRIGRVCWSDGDNANRPAPGSTFALPTGLDIANTSLIVARASVTSDRLILFPLSLDTQTVYFRPRQADRGGANNIEQVRRTGVALC